MAEVQVATAGDLETQPPLPGVYLKLAGKVWGSGFRVQGFRVYFHSKLAGKAWGSGFRVQGFRL